jgi:hypothetical protein
MSAGYDHVECEALKKRGIKLGTSKFRKSRYLFLLRFADSPPLIPSFPFLYSPGRFNRCYC